MIRRLPPSPAGGRTCAESPPAQGRISACSRTRAPHSVTIVGAAAPAALASPSGGSGRRPIGVPPGGTGAKQKERSGEFAAFTSSPNLSVVIKQGSAGRCKPLPQCLPRARGRCPSAHTGADEVLDLSSGRFVNRPYDAAGRGSGGDQRSPLRRDGTHAYPPVTVAGSGDSPLQAGGLDRTDRFPASLLCF